MRETERPEGNVRLAEPGDAEVIGALLDRFNREYSMPTPGADFLARRVRALLERDQLTVLLVGARPDGFVQLRFRPTVWSDGLEAYLEELYVVPERRGEGLGRALLDAALETARARGADRIDLGTSEDDVAARALYESAGFTNREGPDGPIMFFYERELGD